MLVKVVILPELKLGDENSISCSRKSVNKIELFHGTMLTQISNSIEVKVNVLDFRLSLEREYSRSPIL